MSFEVKMITDSIGPHNRRITTYQLKYPRYIHAELMTHRVFSRNASSSRAIPVKKLAELALSEMVEPIQWGMNQAGMQAKAEELTGESLEKAKQIWGDMARYCANGAQQLAELGLHKQWANRPLEWFSNINVVLTTTERSNWEELRYHPDAQPEIYNLAKIMKEVTETSKPRLLNPGEWHMPYVSEEELQGLEDGGASWYDIAKISAARCCRVSYLKHDGTAPSIEDDLELFRRLAGSVPAHMSPLEHCAMCVDEDKFFFNLNGYKSYRWFYENYEMGKLEAR